jgi:hypothetical protein
VPAPDLRRECYSGFPPHLTPSVAMIDMASGCAKRTYTSDLWCKRCVNPQYFLLCTQGQSEGLGPCF